MLSFRAMRAPRVLMQMAVVGAAVATFAPLAGRTQDLAGKTAEQAYKNIQVLKGTPAAEVVPAMRVIGDSLGVNCDFCHIDDFDTETGYLLRRARVREARTAVGGGTTQTDFEEQTDFDDYRDIGDGTKMPFMFRSANPINRVRINHIKVIDNVPMHDSLFAKPPSRYCEAGFKLQHYDLKTQKFLAYTLTPDCLIAPGAAPLPAEAALGMLEK